MVTFTAEPIFYDSDYQIVRYSCRQVQEDSEECVIRILHAKLKVHLKYFEILISSHSRYSEAIIHCRDRNQN